MKNLYCLHFSLRNRNELTLEIRKAVDLINDSFINELEEQIFSNIIYAKILLMELDHFDRNKHTLPVNADWLRMAKIEALELKEIIEVTSRILNNRKNVLSKVDI